jgi:hypothetical protein
VAGDRITLELSSPFGWKRKPVVVFRGAAQDRRYALAVNGTAVGSFAAAELEQGVEAIVPKP